MLAVRESYGPPGLLGWIMTRKRQPTYPFVELPLDEGHGDVEGPQLVLTTVITLCKGFQIASFIKGLRSQGLQSAEQITGLIQNLRNAEQRYLKLGQGQPYLAARQEFMD